MKLFVCICLTLCVASTLVDAAKIAGEQKLKREAPLSSGGYYGPSNKYLPPGSASGVNKNHYDFGNSGFASSYHATANSGHGSNKVGAGFSGLEQRHDHSSGSKIETFVLQAEHGHGGYDFGGSGASALGSSSNFGGHDSSHKVQTTLIPTNSLNGGHLGGGGYTYLKENTGLHSVAGISSGSSFGHGTRYSSGGHGISSGSSGHNTVAGVSTSESFGHDRLRGNVGYYSTGYHYGPSTQFSGFGTSSSFAGEASLNTGHEHGLATHSRNAEHGTHGSVENGLHHGSSAGYTYNAPSISETSYEVPSEAASPLYTSQNHATSSSYNVAGEEAPIYALGHKGLGHFSFTSSKPQVLNTNIIDSGKHLTVGYKSKAPFKPSTFLGSTQEGGAAYTSISGQYGGSVKALTVQYLPPPTGGGYDYQPPKYPSALYDTPSSDSTTSSHEPETSYLPPHQISQSSYGPPAAPSDSFLPPNSLYGSPHH